MMDSSGNVLLFRRRRTVFFFNLQSSPSFYDPLSVFCIFVKPRSLRLCSSKSPLNQTSLLSQFKMETSIHTLPIEVLHIVFADLALTSSAHDVLEYALVCCAWSQHILPLLYHSVSLSTLAAIRTFTKCPVKKSYKIKLLSLFADDDGESEDVLADEEAPELLAKVFNSLTRQSVRTLVIGRYTRSRWIIWCILQCLVRRSFLFVSPG